MLKKTKAIKIFVLLVLLTSFFNAFAIINYDNASLMGQSGFGIQFSWLMGFFLCMLSYTKYLQCGKVKLYKNLNRNLLIVILTISIFDFLVISSNLIILQDNIPISVNRGIIHCTYTIICYCISNSIYVYMLKKHSYSERLAIIRKFFITIPFIFICLWGTYQWISTFDLIQYLPLFNNNVSTGFTYLRFKAAHRTSSIFAEPSEYAYYLGMFAPIIISYASLKTNLFSLRPSRINRFMVVLLYVSQCCFAQSFSLLMVMPLLLFITFCQQKRKKKKVSIPTVISIVVLTIMLITILVVSKRTGQIASGRDSSTSDRLRVFLSGMSLFFQTPLTGIGFGTFRAMDHISATLAFLGIIGALCFLFYLYKLKYMSQINEYSKILYTSYLCFLIVGCAGNCLYEFLPFWLMPVLIMILSREA